MTKNSKKIKELLRSISGLEQEHDAINRRIEELKAQVSILVAEDQDREV